jgi:hypothetical protein
MQPDFKGIHFHITDLRAMPDKILIPLYAPSIPFSRFFHVQVDDIKNLLVADSENCFLKGWTKSDDSPI